MRYPSRFTLVVPLALAAVALGACSKAPEAAATADKAVVGDKAAPTAQAAAPVPGGEHATVDRAVVANKEPLPTKKFGAEITEKSSTPLNTLVKEPARFTAKTVRTEGVVSAVCQEMGCWMELADEAGQAHIKMAGHSFFIPRSASGHRAVVQGKVLNAEKDDCGEEAEAATGKVAKVQIEATGVEFVD